MKKRRPAMTVQTTSKPVTLTLNGKPFEVGDLKAGSEITFDPRTGAVLAINEARRPR